MQYSVKIDAFEGPLDLLLHLIKRMEIDIYDIPVAEITTQYLSYIETMNELELNVASEYLVMAATLIAIKSRMLIPNAEMEAEEGENPEQEEDPLTELMQQLIEYKQYKEAAQDFKNLEAERALMFTRAPDDLSEFIPDTPSFHNDTNVTIYDMIAAFQKLLRRQKLQKPLHTKVARQEISVDKRMEEVLAQILQLKQVLFSQLFETVDKRQLVITFLAILELMKLNKIHVEQKTNLDDIMLHAKEVE